MPASGKCRCQWAVGDPMVRDHDRAWGMPVHNDRRLFVFLVLEGAQAGSSWATVLDKRTAYREVLAHFDERTIARYTAGQVQTSLTSPRIIRTRRKSQDAIHNAGTLLAAQQKFGRFDRPLWRWRDGHSLRNRWRPLKPSPPAPLNPTP